MPKQGQKMVWWTEKEIDIIRKHYCHTPMDELLKMLPNRTHLAIVEKSRLLGFTGRFRFKPYVSWSLPKIEDTHAAYIAGLFDGEGSISLIGTRWGCARLTITNTNQEVLIYIKSLLNDYGTVYERTWGSSQTRPCFMYYVGALGKIEAILTQISPFIRIKRRQVDAMLAYIQNRKQRGTLPHTMVRKHVQEMRVLNFPRKAPKGALNV